MKNKKLIYVLLPLVLLIWGLVIYKVMGGPSSNAAALPEVQLPPPGSDIAVQLDTFDLVADYSDPFLDRKLVKFSSGLRAPAAPRARTVVPRHPRQRPKPEPPKTVVKWPEVVCQGRVTNLKSATQIVVMSVDGRSLAMREGEVLKAVTLAEIGADSVLVQFQDEERRLAVK